MVSPVDLARGRSGVQGGKEALQYVTDRRKLFKTRGVKLFEHLESACVVSFPSIKPYTMILLVFISRLQEVFGLAGVGK